MKEAGEIYFNFTKLKKFFWSQIDFIYNLYMYLLIVHLFRSVITNKKDAYHAAEKMYQKLKAEKKEMKEARLVKQKEKIDALNKYKAEKALKYKKLCKKTKKGQPVMKDRLEMLLEKIQQTS